MVELLAPAGTLEIVYAAFRSGADAVYCGGKRFGARAFAENLSMEDLRSAVGLAHAYGGKLYVTLNTLLKNNEFKDALMYAESLHRIGVDAIILQDMALGEIIKNQFPGIEVHASTQAGLHNTAAIKKFEFLDRIILPRELSKRQIGEIANRSNKPIEVFVHGALCNSFSGQCLMSSMIGGRSGNRGRCAQPCRKRYGAQYALSTADLCLYQRIPELISIGVSSLKIEGRMKSIDYVKTVVSIYRRALDAASKGSFRPSDEDMAELKLSFNRTFTEGFFSGDNILAEEMPGNRGLFLGTAKRGVIHLESSLSLGDGIRYGRNGRTVRKIIIDNKRVKNAKKGDKVFIPGIEGNIYKMNEAKSRPVAERTIPLSVDISIGDDIKVDLETAYQKVSKTFDTKAEPAKKAPIGKKIIEKNFSKIIKTPFRLSKLDFSMKKDLFLPYGTITKIRDECIAELLKPELKDKIEVSLPKLEVKRRDDIQFLVKVKDLAGVREAEHIADIIYIDIFSKDLKISKKYAKEKDIDLFVSTPPLTFHPMDEMLLEKIDEIDPRGVLAGNPGFILNDRETHLGPSFNILNDFQIKSYGKHAILSPELNLDELKSFKDKSASVFVHGEIILMKTLTKPGGDGSLNDGKVTFKVRKNPAGYYEVLNNRMLGMFQDIERLVNIGFKSFYFDLESDVGETLKKYQDILAGKKVEFDRTRYMRGHLLRGTD